MLKKIFKRKEGIELFWDWFTKNADKYFHFENNQDVLFKQLKNQLNNIDSNLVFEFSPILEDGTREFVISADGIKSSFPSVINLTNKAPKLYKWKIISFRQPHMISQIKYENLIINLKDIFFRYAKDNGKTALELNIRGFYESAEWSTAIFIVLDNVLGEYDTEMSLNTINKKELNEKEIGTLFPITALPEIIQDYKLEFNN